MFVVRGDGVGGEKHWEQKDHAKEVNLPRADFGPAGTKSPFSTHVVCGKLIYTFNVPITAGSVCGPTSMSPCFS